MTGKLLTRIAVAVMVLLLSTQSASSQHLQSREYNIKAVFLYNFSQFIDWPLSSFANASSPFIIGILGNDPFQFILDKTVTGEKVKGHPIIIQRFQNLHEMKNCHILYVAEKNDRKIKDIIAALKDKNTLTVSDHSSFTKWGGMVRFLTVNNKIKLQINLPVSKASSINISSKLLSIADIVGIK